MATVIHSPSNITTVQPRAATIVRAPPLGVTTSVKGTVVGGTVVEGPPGTPGSKWFVGQGIPSLDLGVTGDQYFDTTTGDVYTKDEIAGWITDVNFVTDAGLAPLESPAFTGVLGLTGASAVLNDVGTAGSGDTVTFDVSAGVKQTLTVAGPVTIAFSNWAPAGQYSECTIILINGSSGVVSWEGVINWYRGDGSTSTNFADMGVTLSQLNPITVFTLDGGTTRYGRAM